MNTQLKSFEGMRAGAAFSKGCCPRSFQGPLSSRRVGLDRGSLQVVAMRKSRKKKQIVLLENVKHVGQKGELATVAMGYWRNYLGPQGLAMQATDDILERFRAEQEAVEEEKQKIKNKALALATALQTIGKFVVKKKSGEQDKIYGSVTTQEIAEAIYMQTGQQLEKSKIMLPDIKELGEFEATVKLHPEVVGSFKISVQREKNA